MNNNIALDNWRYFGFDEGISVENSESAQVARASEMIVGGVMYHVKSIVTSQKQFREIILRVATDEAVKKIA